jgi:AcrR family transcriptional regulator
MKYSREYILRRAFDIFMQKGYDSTSISVLQEGLSMSRGAMYRYFKNKEELFHAVIDEYFFRLFGRFLYKMDDHNFTVSEFIEITHRRHKLIIGAFIKAGVTHTVFLNYTALMIQAVKYYPGFVSRFREINRQLISHWRQALKNSIVQGDVRPDIDIEIMSILFNNTSAKETSDRDCNQEEFTINIIQDITKRKQVVDYLYSLIKI